MLKHLVAVAALGALLTNAAAAQSPAPANAEDCLKAAFEIAQAAEDKNLPADKLDKVEELLSKMEDHCDAQQLADAQKVGNDIKSMLSQ